MSLLLVSANFYPDLSAFLLEGARKKASAAGVETVVVEVMGALEIPAVIAFAAKQFQGFVALGCVIRGETSHYDTVAEQSAAGLQKLAIEQQLAIGNGILTVENYAQAATRANPLEGDKGGFAVEACLGLIALKQRFEII